MPDLGSGLRAIATDLRTANHSITLLRPMKAERRHELKANTLAESLRDIPELARQWGSAVLLAAVIIALAIVLLRTRANNAAEARRVDSQNLLSAHQHILQLQGLFGDLARIDDPSPGIIGEIKSLRDQNISDASSELQSVQRDTSTDDVLQAEELETEGDLALALAQLPDLPGADHDPALKLNTSPEEYLKNAASSYQQVIQKFPAQKMAVVNSRFGLATIAEDQQDWAAARTQYQAIIDESADSPAVKKRAQAQMNALDSLAAPVYLGTPPPPTGFTNLMPSVPPPDYLRIATTAPSTPATAPAAH